MTDKGRLSQEESKRAEGQVHPRVLAVRGRSCAGCIFSLKSLNEKKMKSLNGSEQSRDEIEGIYSKSQSRDRWDGLNANLLGCKAPDYFTALLPLSGAQGAQQWEGILTSSLSRLMEQQSHLLSPSLSSSVFFALLQGYHSFHTCSPPCLNGYSLIIFSPQSILFPGLHPPPTQLNLLTPHGLSPFLWPFPLPSTYPNNILNCQVCRSSPNAEHFQEKSRKTKTHSIESTTYAFYYNEADWCMNIAIEMETIQKKKRH